MTTTFFMALGLVFVIEGLVYALVPGQLKNMMTMMAALPDEALRTGGMFAIGLGVFVVWLTQAVFSS